MIATPDGAGLVPKSNPKDHNFNRPVRAARIPPQVWRPTLSGGSALPFGNLSDHFLIRMYENIREEARAEARSGAPLLGAPARERAES